MRRRCQGSPKGNAKEGMVSLRKARDGKVANERDEGGNRENIVNNASTITMWPTSEEFGSRKQESPFKITKSEDSQSCNKL